MNRPGIASLDHLVLTVADIDTTLGFYCDVLGMTRIDFTGGDGIARVAIGFGAQKINLHQAGAEIVPHADRATPGSADLCFLTKMPVEDWLDHLTDNGINPLTGIVQRSGATGPLRSVYLRDPDGNLIELSNPA